MKQHFLFFCAASMLLPATGCSHSQAPENPRRAAPPPTNLIARIHFAGAPAIAADPDSGAFTNLWLSPEARALRAQTLDKLARAPYEFLRSRLYAGVKDQAARLRPLVEDLFRAEWRLDVRDATNGSPEFALAVRLDAARARLWQTNLAGVLEDWTKLPADKIPNGWQLKKHQPPNLIRCVRAGGWLVLGCGQDELPLNDRTARALTPTAAAPRAGKDWLSVEMNWARAGRWLAWTNQPDWTNLPVMKLLVSARDGNLRLDGTATFPRPPALDLEPWRLPPTNLLHEPFVSFTAARGFAHWLEGQPWAQAYALPPEPGQFFAWALAQAPFQTYVAVPVSNATNAVRQLGEKLAAQFNGRLKARALGFFETAANDAEVGWRGLPFVAPFVQAVHEPAGDYLLAGLFPNSSAVQPPPAALMTELSRTNLVYYHWEITAERLPQVLNLSQLALMLTHHKQLDAQSAAGKWLHHVGPALGNTVTEITQTASNELAFTRKAPGGLTAIELIALANWLEATNFPGCDLRLPPQPPIQPGGKPARQNH
ncbi:MAG: hypothetical protein KGJ60_03800 [Verrucomicrobiota bacterium]|nr:hypothetical protein [Verrucomicrobiota bacterium]